MQHTVPTEFWSTLNDGRIQCDVCPRLCKLRPGQRGMCFVRARAEDEVVLTTYGRSSGFCVDPVEKKPLNHFLPGTATLSFGTAGCNLACSFCQNWDISKSREVSRLSEEASPESIARTATELECKSVSFTYNDPVIFLEYACDVADACRERGIRSVAVTAGYVMPEPRAKLFRHLDAANIDLKGFSERFYRDLCAGGLAAVLDTIEYVHRETDVWLELTTLLIPGENDSEQELDALTSWVADALGPEVPIHFTAFHPDWRLRNKPRTPLSTLLRARRAAIDNGLRYCYVGNVRDRTGSATWCSGCGAALIERDGYALRGWRLDSDGACTRCGARCAGVFESEPGAWGARRLPVRISR